MERPFSVAFCAGDPSGDQHAAGILKELHNIHPNLRCWGIGGPEMQKEGFQPILPFAQFNRMGFAEVITHLPFFLKAKKTFVKQLSRTPPEVLVCVDYPGFNMELLKEAHKLKIPVVWYIAPMVWAWKKKRAQTLGNLASHIAVIFPFEVQYFDKFRAPVSFVGNPLSESIIKEEKSNQKRRSLPQQGSPIRLAVVPGSRKQEIDKMLPPMLSAAKILKKEYPNLQITVSKYQGFNNSYFKRRIDLDCINIFPGSLRNLLESSDIAMVTSGTASLETALMGVPHVIAYRTSTINYEIMKRLVKIPHIGLPNVIAREKIVPELIQRDVNPQRLASEIKSILNYEEKYNTMAQKLYELRTLLGERNSSLSLAQIIFSFYKTES
ncbi:Lipid-A-disaccharide synthase [Chitinispirillum alkaliphilum]|nr:Lipid-A-disaccharide synthase [Chitinispirillum alkaliphilum]